MRVEEALTDRKGHMRQMSLYDYTSRDDGASRHENTTAPLEVYDLFCGAGGFSTGARAAGCNVVFACDSSEKAIETHKRNHPSTTHLVCELPRDDLPLPTDGRPFHLHASPPCQRFSQANKHKGDWRNKEAAVALVEWYLQYALASRATSWSMEQVAAPEVVEVVERVRRKHRGRVAYAVLRFDRLGVPQARKRLIAGSSRLVAKLLGEASQQPTRSIRDAIVEPRGAYVRGGTKHKRHTQRAVVAADGSTRYEYDRAKWSDFLCSLDGPAPTVTGRGGNLWWITGTPGEESYTHRARLRPSELAALQTFPPDYRLPANIREAIQQVGNAVPPRVAELMLRAESRRANLSFPSERRPRPEPIVGRGGEASQ